MKTIVTTLVLIKKNNKILLGFCKRGFSKDKYNGIGGKVDPGESVRQAMIRETQEEIGVTPTKFEKMAILNFDEIFKNERCNIVTHVYLCDEYSGEIAESEEMIPHWFNLNEIAFSQMFPDDKYWLPEILCGKKLKAFFTFDKNFVIQKLTLKFVDKFPKDDKIIIRKMV